MTCSSLMPKSLGDVGPYYAHDPIQFEIETGFPQVPQGGRAGVRKMVV